MVGSLDEIYDRVLFDQNIDNQFLVCNEADQGHKTILEGTGCYTPS